MPKFTKFNNKNEEGVELQFDAMPPELQELAKQEATRQVQSLPTETPQAIPAEQQVARLKGFNQPVQWNRLLNYFR